MPHCRRRGKVLFISFRVAMRGFDPDQAPRRLKKHRSKSSRF
jgi:hypothetical protein